MSSAETSHTQPQYELLYHPGIPGRGEFVRLVFEAAGIAYKDISNESEQGAGAVYTLITPDSTGDRDGNPPAFAPPALRISGEGTNSSALLIYQTPSILSYLGDKLDLAGDDEAERAWILSHTLTALDLNNEIHDTHHPIAVAEYYEAQKQEALRKARDVRENRIPKFLNYFERVLIGNQEQGGGIHLVGDRLSYADTTLWHVLSGLEFSFPKEIAATRENYPTLFDGFYLSVKEQDGLRAYLASDRRKPFGMGIYRHYPELDRQ